MIVDPEQLRRVINNIVSNSLKYMDKKHGIINIRILDVGDFVQVEIEDNGKGIAAKDIPYIFDRFYRTDSSRNSAKGGSGIGLSTVSYTHLDVYKRQALWWPTPSTWWRAISIWMWFLSVQPSIS